MGEFILDDSVEAKMAEELGVDYSVDREMTEEERRDVDEFDKELNGDDSSESS